MEFSAVVQLSIALMPVLTTVLFKFVIPYFQAKTDIEVQNNIKATTKTWVDAAEEIYKMVPKSGDAKHTYVAKYIMTKFDIAEEEAHALIKAAVQELNNSKAWLEGIAVPEEQN